MSVQVPATYAASATDWTATSNSRLPVKTLGQNDFLRLLITQLSSQDPLNPQKDSEFIAQMAQFSSLEQTKSMQSDMAALRTEQQLLQANVLLGQTVELQVDKNTTTTGIVSAVQMDAGTPKLVVDGQAYDLSQLLTITPTPLNP
jgi:flagellar basal-body rod modification protein FlgD